MTTMVAEVELLARVSWGILALALLSDTAHVRSIPSYNLAIGAWACYLGHYRFKSSNIGNENGDPQHEQEKQKIRTMATTFSFACAITIIFDIVYCGVWGSEIFRGRYKGLKFATVMYIFNCFAKLAACFWSFKMVVEKGGSQQPSDTTDDTVPPPVEEGGKKQRTGKLKDDSDYDYDTDGTTRHIPPDGAFSHYDETYDHYRQNNDLDYHNDEFGADENEYEGQTVPGLHESMEFYYDANDQRSAYDDGPHLGPMPPRNAPTSAYYNRNVVQSSLLSPSTQPGSIAPPRPPPGPPPSVARKH